MAIEPIERSSRRAFVAGVVGGVAAAVAGTLGRAQPTAAVDGDPLILGVSNGTTHLTRVLNVNTDGNGFAGYADGSGSGLFGRSPSGRGVYGNSDSGTGVYGESGSGVGVEGAGLSDYGVRGISQSSYGVYGTSQSSYGVAGTSNSSYGIYGASSASAASGILGESLDNGTAVQGYSGSASTPSSPSGTGVFGYADQDSASVGVRGGSSTGRGAVLSGKLGQLKLKPSTATTHPSSGQAGDLFVDGSHRLWFCKGGTTWKQLA